MSEEHRETHITYVNSPIGVLKLTATVKGLSALTLVEAMPREKSDISSEILRTSVAQLEEYFAGERKQFDLTYDLDHHSEFYNKVWTELLKIDYGKKISYGELARRVGDPKAAQAVGMANGKNPIAIIVPCHRVVGSGGSLTGYAWGLDKKRWLLLHELAHVPVPDGQLF